MPNIHRCGDLFAGPSTSGVLAELSFLYRMFYEGYAGAAGCLACEEGYKNRAAATYDYARRFISDK